MSILCYHSVQPGWDSPLAITPRAFAAHCDWLARTKRVLHLPDAVHHLATRGRLPRGTTALTFDDGFEALWEHAVPTLTRTKLPATVFLVAQTLTPGGRPVDWVDTPPPFPLTTLDRDQVLAMRERGFRFGSHSYAHFDLTVLSEQECEGDLRQSREVLEDLLHEPVPYLAYPRGRHDERVRRAARRAGYTHAFTLPEAGEPFGPFALPRIGVYPGNGRGALRVKLSPGYLRLRTSPAFPLLRMAVRGRRPPRRPPG